MQTPIGKCLGDSLPRRVACGALAVTVLLGDFALVRRGYARSYGLRSVLPVVVQLVLLLLARGDYESAGQRWRPLQSVRYWVEKTLWIGMAVGAFVALPAILGAILGFRSFIYTLPPTWRQILDMCVFAPVVEEAVYRLAFCTAAVAAIGPRATILASGVAFASRHIVDVDPGVQILYGDPGAGNLVAGFFLAWAYLQSGTILVPITLHALGNLCVVLAWVGMWYWNL